MNDTASGMDIHAQSHPALAHLASPGGPRGAGLGLAATPYGSSAMAATTPGATDKKLKPSLSFYLDPAIVTAVSGPAGQPASQPAQHFSNTSCNTFYFPALADKCLL